jgi:hypothetical protein
VSSEASQPSKPVLTVKDLPKYLGQIIARSNTIEQMLAGEIHVVRPNPIDKRDLVLVRLHYRLGEKVTLGHKDSPAWYECKTMTLDRITQNQAGEVKLTDFPQKNPLVFKALANKEEVKQTCDDVEAFIQDDKNAKRDTDLILICLEDYRSMILRTGKPPASEDEKKVWKKTELGKAWLKSFHELYQHESVQVFAIAKLPRNHAPDPKIDVNTRLRIIKDKQGILGPKV